MAELVGSASFAAGASDADDKTIVLDVKQPRGRYVRSVVERRTADAVIDGVIALQYQAGDAPTSHDAGVIADALLVAPAEA